MPHSVKEVSTLERASYFQGTVRCNYIGEVSGPVYCYDINSAYPAVMLDGLVPTELIEWDTNDKPRDPLCRGPLTNVIAEVLVTTGYPRYPMRVGSHACYPVGTFWTTLCGPELEYAYRRSELQRIGRHARYELGNLFGKFITEFWRLRSDYQARKNAVMGDLCKIMMNSLAGKFGQRTGKWRKRSDLIAPFPWGRYDEYNKDTGKWGYYRSLAWLVEESVEQGEHPNGFPAVAAWVTSLARVRMLNILEKIQDGGRIYYSAVDSIHGDSGINSRLLESDEVGDKCGQLRQELVASQATYRGIANYSLDGQMHVAGLPAQATVDESGRMVTRHLEARPPEGKHNGFGRITENTLIRTITPPYLHGHVNADGWTSPWVLPLEETEMRKCLENATPTYFT